MTHLACGWEAINSTARSTDCILSASLSGISNPNSSSSAITTSTVSKLSSPRSFWKCAFDVTCNNTNHTYFSSIKSNQTNIYIYASSGSCPHKVKKQNKRTIIPIKNQTKWVLRLVVVEELRLAITLEGSTFWKVLTTETTRSVTSDLSRNDPLTSSEKRRRRRTYKGDTLRWEVMLELRRVGVTLTLRYLSRAFLDAIPCYRNITLEPSSLSLFFKGGGRKLFRYMSC